MNSSLSRVGFIKAVLAKKSP